MSVVNINKNSKVTSIESADPTKTNPNGSTGPITEDGKHKASRNSEKHGCTSTFPVVDGRVSPEVEKRIVLPDERVEDWEALKASWHSEYQPVTDVQWTLVTHAVIAEWVLRRTLRRYNEVEQSLFTDQPDATEWTPEQHAKLELFLRYQVKAERAFHRARAAVDVVRRERKQDAEKAQAQTPAAQPSARPKTSPSAKSEDHSLTADSTEGTVQLLPRTFSSFIQCITVQVLDGKTFTLFQPRSENLTRMILSAPDPKPVVKRALYFLDGIPAEYEWVTEYENHDGRPHFVLTRTSEQALQELENERRDGSGHVLPVDPSDDRQ